MIFIASSLSSPYTDIKNRAKSGALRDGAKMRLPCVFRLAHYRTAIGERRRWRIGQNSATANAAENIQVEEVHSPQHDQRRSDLPRQRLNRPLHVPHVVTELQGQADVAKI